MLILPSWLPQEVWNEYVKMRRKIRKPLTDYAEKLAIKKLAELKACGYDPVAVLEDSIFNDWAGLFAPKGEPNDRTQRINAAANVGKSPRPEDFGVHVRPEVLERIRRERERKLG